MSYYAGIDPGVTGSIAFYNGVELKIHDLPTNKRSFHTHKIRQQIDAEKLADIFRLQECKFVMLENVHSQKGDGHVGAFTFGKTVGIIEGVLGTLNIPVITIEPSVWKPQLGLNSQKEKSLVLARQKFPLYTHYFERKKDHNRAESALLAWIAYTKFGSKALGS